MTVADLLAALQGLGSLGFFGWFFLGLALLWLNARAGLPRARRDLQLRGGGFALFLVAAVLGLGQGLVALWPWPPQAALLCAAAAPLLAGWLLANGRWGWGLLLGFSFPFFLLIALTAFVGQWLDLRVLGGGLLALALLASGVGALLTWRLPRPEVPPFATHFQFRRGFGGPGFGRRGPANDDDVVDVQARDIDEPPPPALPR